MKIWRARLGDPGRDSNMHIWVLSATWLGKSKNPQTFQKEVRILKFLFVLFSVQGFCLFVCLNWSIADVLSSVIFNVFLTPWLQLTNLIMPVYWFGFSWGGGEGHAERHEGSSLTRDRTCAPAVDTCNPSRGTTSEGPNFSGTWSTLLVGQLLLVSLASLPPLPFSLLPPAAVPTDWWGRGKLVSG